MNVLFVTYDFPYPTNSGGKNRAYHLLKHTAKEEKVYLFAFARDDYNPEHNKEILNLNVVDIKVFKRRKFLSLKNIPSLFTNSSIFKSLYYDKSFEAEMVRFIKEKKIELVHFESSYTGYYIGERLKRLNVKCVLGTENIEFMLYKDLESVTKKVYLKPFLRYQSERLKKEELNMVRKSDFVTTITKIEADILESLTGVRCRVVANGIEPDIFSYNPDSRVKKNILFVGNFTYFPNIDGIEFFIKEVLPTLSKDLRLTIIGKNCLRVVKSKDPRVIKKDFVEDIIGEYRNADILVFPIRIGGGTNFKILEAMSLGLPIVANPERLSGLNAIEGVHFLGAIRPEEYRMQIEKIYQTKKLSVDLVSNARLLVEKTYSWQTIGHNLINVWRG